MLCGISLSTVEEEEVEGEEDGEEEMKEGQGKKKMKDQFIGETILSNF